MSAALSWSRTSSRIWSTTRGRRDAGEFAVASQSLVVEARALAGPVSYELASTSKAEGIEDRTSMAPLSARRLAEMVDLGARDAYKRVRHLVPFTAPGQAPPEDLEPLVEAVRSGEIALVLSPAG